MAAIENTASQQSDPLVTAEAHTVVVRFKKGFKLFGKCHNLFNKTILAQEEIYELSKSITIL